MTVCPKCGAYAYKAKLCPSCLKKGQKVVMVEAVAKQDLWTNRGIAPSRKMLAYRERGKGKGD